MRIKRNNYIGSIAAVALLAGFLAGCASEQDQQARLQSQATLTRADAEKIALAKVPGGEVKEGELEKEHGKLVYSFDISKPGSSDLTEIQIDARSGEVVSIENESAEKEAREKK
jgi:uncharacterized membrane protein YkoI